MTRQGSGECLCSPDVGLTESALSGSLLLMLAQSRGGCPALGEAVDGRPVGRLPWIHLASTHLVVVSGGLCPRVRDTF